MMVFPTGLFAGEILWFWLAVSTGNVYVAIAVSFAAVLVALYGITIRVRHQTGRWWFVRTDRSLFLERPPWNTSTEGFWDRIQLLSDDTLL